MSSDTAENYIESLCFPFSLTVLQFVDFPRGERILDEIFVPPNIYRHSFRTNFTTPIYLFLNLLRLSVARHSNGVEGKITECEVGETAWILHCSSGGIDLSC